jgi:hypothetical protein
MDIKMQPKDFLSFREKAAGATARIRIYISAIKHTFTLAVS